MEGAETEKAKYKLFKYNLKGFYTNIKIYIMACISVKKRSHFFFTAWPHELFWYTNGWYITAS